HKRLQRFLQELKARGVILAVCSKNERAAAVEPFDQHPEMLLRRSDISAFVANWDPKPLNIQRIAQELNLGADAMVFVDDNPAERELVRKSLPEIAVLELPDDVAEYASALSEAGLFEVVSLTAEDVAKSAQYRANALRAVELATCASYDE